MTEWLRQVVRAEIVDRGKLPVLLLLLGLVAGFVVIRTSARLIRARARWWPGDVVVRGVHLHHEVFGVVVMAATGGLAFALPSSSAWFPVLAFAFGAALGLVLDEFALLLHLQDVYWQREGRRSIDAVVLATALTAMVLLGAAPFSVADALEPGADEVSRWLAVAVVALNLGLTTVTALKGKYWTALASVPLWGVGIVGAVRLARPDSPWARRRYATRPDRLDRARRRAARWDGWRQGLLAAAAGRTDP